VVLSVLLRFTDSDYPFGIFKLFLCQLTAIPPFKISDIEMIHHHISENFFVVQCQVERTILRYILFFYIHILSYYQMMLMSLRSNTTSDISGAGTVKLSGAYEIVSSSDILYGKRVIA
jgi:hypothetical protein